VTSKNSDKKPSLVAAAQPNRYKPVIKTSWGLEGAR
jgi:hypothetical protein